MTQKPPNRRTPFGLVSILIFLGTLLVYFLVFGVFESAILGLSGAAERWLTIVLVALPATAGAILGAFGLVRPGQNRLLAALGFLLNALFALFILLVLAIAG
jgi:hypothetical protein